MASSSPPPRGSSPSGSSPLAEIALIDVIGQNPFFVRGNYCIHIRLIPDSVVAPDPDLKEPLEPHAQRLDAFFAASSLPSGQQRVPLIHLKDPTPTEVNVGESFIFEAHQVYAAIDGASSNCASVICAGPSTEIRSGVEFFALAEGEVELSLNVAHRETLMPATERWTVSVKGSSSG